MTEKEKAEAYDKAIERAIKHRSHDGLTLEQNETIDIIFPELKEKESENERIRKEIIELLRNWASLHYISKEQFSERMAWLEKQRDKDKLIQELGEYKVKYTQEVLEKYINSMSNKDDERLRKTAIAFLKDFAEQGYENAVECIDWLEKQGEQASSQTNERAWLYLVSDVLTWKDGIGQYLDDSRVQELAKRLCSKYSQKLYNPSKFALENQWISVKEDLPCNHEELIHTRYNLATQHVVTNIQGQYYINRMLKYKGRWVWETGEPTHWFPIPKLP